MTTSDSQTGAPSGAPSARSPFTRACIALDEGLTVRVADQEGRLGTVINLADAEPAERLPGEATVLFDKGGAVRYTADRFNMRLRIVSPR